MSIRQQQADSVPISAAASAKARRQAHPRLFPLRAGSDDTLRHAASSNTPKLVKQALAVMLALALSVALLTGAIWALGTSQSFLLKLMTQHAPSRITALPEAEYPAMADMLARYLSGRSDEFQLIFAIDGTAYYAFGAREQQHMADCQALFQLDRRVGLSAVVFSVLLAALLWRMRHTPGSIRKGLRQGLLGVMATVVALGCWIATDFERAFVLFHQLCFTNDLWLLHPQTDLLIRLMPVSFFIHAAALLGLIWLTGMLLMLLAVLIYRKDRKEGRTL